MSLPTERKPENRPNPKGKVDSHFAGRPLSFGEGSTPLHMEFVHEGPNRRFPPILEIIVLQVPAVHFVWWYIWLSPLKKRDNKK